MRPGSAYLAALARPHDNEAGVPIVSLWSWHDSMVTPQTSSRLEGAENIVIAGVAHNAMLGDGDVWNTRRRRKYAKPVAPLPMDPLRQLRKRHLLRRELLLRRLLALLALRRR